MRRTIRLTESDLHRIIKESVKKIVNETRGKRFDVEESVDEVKGFHGNKPGDWARVGAERYTRALDADASGEERKRNFIKGVKNMKNANQVTKKNNR